MAPLVSGRTHHADAPRLGTVVPAPSGPQRSGTAAPTVPGSSPVVPRLLLDEQRHVVVTGQHERRQCWPWFPQSWASRGSSVAEGGMLGRLLGKI